MKRHLVALLAFIALTIVATHPLWQHLADSVPGDVGDPVLNSYILAWDTHALVSDPLHLFDANIFYPLPNTLAYSENLIGDALLALPIALLTGEPLLAYNFTFLASFVLAAFGMYLFVFQLTRNRRAAFAAGLAFAFAPYRLASLAHIQLLTVQWLPLIAWSMVRGLSSVPRSTLRASDQFHWMLLPIFVWLQVASSLHGAAFALLMISVFVVVRMLRFAYASRITHHAPRITHHASRIAIPSLILMLSLIPLALPYLAILDQLRAARTPEAAPSFAAMPSDFFAAAPFNRFFGSVTAPLRTRDGFTEEQMLFMGVVAPLLALLGLGRRRWGIGPALNVVEGWVGALLIVGLLLATQPLLTTLIPFASIMRVPARWAVVLTFALAALCGLGVSKLLTAQTRRTQSAFVFAPFASAQLILLCLLALALYAEAFSAPMPLARIGFLQAQTGVYHYLARQSDHAAVIELPLNVAPDAEFPEGKRMYASALHWHPLVNGYSGYTPARQMTLSLRLKNFPDDEAIAALRDLAREGVRYLIVHSGEPGIPRRDWVQVNRARALNSGALTFVQSFDDNDLFIINAP